MEEAYEEEMDPRRETKMGVWCLSQNKGCASAYDTFFRNNPDYARIKASTPSWLAEVVAFAQVLTHTGILKKGIVNLLKE